MACRAVWLSSTWQPQGIECIWVRNGHGCVQGVLLGALLCGVISHRAHASGALAVQLTQPSGIKQLEQLLQKV